MVKLVKQESTHDCAAACLAMVLGMQRASDVYPWLGGDPSEFDTKGLYDTEVLSVLEKAGKSYTCQQVVTGLSKKDYATRRALATEQELRIKLNSQQSGSAIVGLPSLNHKDGYHFVVCCRGEVFDPSNEKVYVGTAYSLPVISVIFVKDAV